MVNYWKKGIKPSKIGLLTTTYPIAIIISIVGAFYQSWLFLTFPFILIFIGIVQKPVTHCDTCLRPLKKKVEGFIEHHVQCNCVENRWRPVWYSWMENLRLNIWRRFGWIKEK